MHLSLLFYDFSKCKPIRPKYKHPGVHFNPIKQVVSVLSMFGMRLGGDSDGSKVSALLGLNFAYLSALKVDKSVSSRARPSRVFHYNYYQLYSAENEMLSAIRGMNKGFQ